MIERQAKPRARAAVPQPEEKKPPQPVGTVRDAKVPDAEKPEDEKRIERFRER